MSKFTLYKNKKCCSVNILASANKRKVLGLAGKTVEIIDLNKRSDNPEFDLLPIKVKVISETPNSLFVTVLPHRNELGLMSQAYNTSINKTSAVFMSDADPVNLYQTVRNAEYIICTKPELSAKLCRVPRSEILLLRDEQGHPADFRVLGQTEIGSDKYFMLSPMKRLSGYKDMFVRSGMTLDGEVFFETCSAAMFLGVTFVHFDGKLLPSKNGNKSAPVDTSEDRALSA